MIGRLPMTIWTASASPAARIMPSTTAVAMPPTAVGMQHVADRLPARRAERERGGPHVRRDRDQRVIRDAR